MNTTKCKVFGIVGALLCVMGIFTGCNKETIDPNKYSSYVCYDYHLKCLEVSGKKAKTEFLYQNALTDATYTESAWIQKIADESDDMFIYAEVLPSLLLGTSDKIVMQNPNNYVNVITDWSIDKIELYYISGHKPIEQDQSANIPTAVIATTSDGDTMAEFERFLADSNEREACNIPDGYANEKFDENGSGNSYYIRIYFKESKNIVWDSQVESYYSSENNNRIIYIDAGKVPDGISSVNAKYMSISDYQNLVAWIYKAITNIKSA